MMATVIGVVVIVLVIAFIAWVVMIAVTNWEKIKTAILYLACAFIVIIIIIGLLILGNALGSYILSLV